MTARGTRKKDKKKRGKLRNSNERGGNTFALDGRRRSRRNNPQGNARGKALKNKSVGLEPTIGDKGGKKETLKGSKKLGELP